MLRGLIQNSSPPCFYRCHIVFALFDPTLRSLQVFAQIVSPPSCLPVFRSKKTLKFLTIMRPYIVPLYWRRVLFVGLAEGKINNWRYRQVVSGQFALKALCLPLSESTIEHLAVNRWASQRGLIAFSWN